jgi:hypothetical protein
MARWQLEGGGARRWKNFEERALELGKLRDRRWWRCGVSRGVWDPFILVRRGSGDEISSVQ